jgi:hypothetical protein
MPYCAECLIEYVKGTTECEDCGAFLLPGSPPASHRPSMADERDFPLVPVRIFTGNSGMEAELACGILESQGISCALSGDVGTVSLRDTHLLVREEDAVHAERVLKEYLDTEVQSSAEESDPTEDA